MQDSSHLPTGPLVFVHMQRCGGSALTHFLEMHFDNRRILKASLLHREENRIVGITGHAGAPTTLEGDLSQYGLIAGHNNFDDVDAIVRDPVYFAMLRNPVDRVVSLYRYWRSHRRDFIERNNLEGPRLAKTLSLDEFVDCEQPEAAFNVNNGMARQLINRMLVPLDMTDEECLEKATNALQRFSFLGVTELMDLSVTLLCRTLGWQAPDTVDPVNTVAQNCLDEEVFEPIEMEPVGPRTSARILERNGVDAQLHHQALKALDKSFRGDKAGTSSRLTIPAGQMPTLRKRVARKLAQMLTDYVHPT